MLNITNIPAPRVPFIDERTGLMAREWYRFFLNLFVLTGSGNNPITLEELQLGPPNQPDLTELLIQINQNIAPQYEDQSGDFLATLDTAQLMSMMARFENAEAAIQGAYLQPVVQTGTIASYNLDSSPTAGGVAYGTGPALAVSAAGTLGQVLTSGGAGAPTWTTDGGGTVTSVSFTGGIITVATATTTPALTVAGTSGGVPYFSGASTWATSALLTNNAIMLGGGAAAAPKTTTTGTGVVTALGVNTGTAGAFVVNGGALGTPSSGVATNLTSLTAANITGSRGIPASTVPAGSVIQVVQTVLTTQFSTASTTYTNVTGLSVAITPQFSTSKILVTANVVLSSTSLTEYSAVQLIRGATAIGNGATGFAIFQNTSNALAVTGVITFLDAPATTSSTTYQIQAISSSAAASATINYRGATTGQTLSSQITVMEIAQ